MNTLGTILPTAASIAATDRHASAVEQLKRSTARKYGLDKHETRIVGGETRYYVYPTYYAIVNRSGKVLWFNETAGGDYAAKKPK